MLVSIINGIANKLFEEYGEEYAIYTDFVEQDFNEPCFFIHIINSSNERELGNRYKRMYSFDIVYFPKEEHCIDELCEISEQLYTALENIVIDGDLIAGIGMNHHIQDGTLHFLVDYVLMVKRTEEEKEKMMVLEQKGRVKNGSEEESE